ncbi:MAG: hypothetical protein LBU03_06535 [Tannerellaceae bacterium]|jgi:hypothetical protein|nr:hypothetical protein [Tannerellaceae bacterium]
MLDKKASSGNRLEILLFTFLLLAIGGCVERNIDSERHTEQIREMIGRGEFNVARNEVDSLRALFPKNTSILREALRLSRHIDSCEAARNVAFCDSLLPIRQAELEAMKSIFSFEKDTAYATPGNYVHRGQTIEHNIGRSYLRSGVTEYGEAYLASVYAGSRPIKHTALRISAPNGLYAETPSIPYDSGRNYRFEDNGTYTEVVTYRGEHCHAVLQFLYENHDVSLRADYLGGKPYHLYVGTKDKADIVATWQFSYLLKDVMRLSAERVKARQRLSYLNSKVDK